MAKRDKTTTTVTNQQGAQEPYGPIKPYLPYGAQEAYNLQNQEVGFNPYEGERVAPMSEQTLGALQGLEQYSTQPNELLSGAYGALSGMLGQDAIQTQGYLEPFARGDYVNGGSPGFNQALDYQSGKLADDVNRGFSGAGRSCAGDLTS